MCTLVKTSVVKHLFPCLFSCDVFKGGLALSFPVEVMQNHFEHHQERFICKSGHLIFFTDAFRAYNWILEETHLIKDGCWCICTCIRPTWEHTRVDAQHFIANSKASNWTVYSGNGGILFLKMSVTVSAHSRGQPAFTFPHIFVFTDLLWDSFYCSRKS